MRLILKKESIFWIIIIFLLGSNLISEGQIEPNYNLIPDDIFISPDGLVQVEQYQNILYEKTPVKDWWKLDQRWKIHSFSRDHQNGCFLNPGERSDYPSEFRCTPNSQWLVRKQKVGAGFDTIFLYKREGLKFVPANAKGLGDLAWDYFYSRPESSGLRRPDFHVQVNLLKGLEDNYKWTGMTWQNSRYIMLSLSGICMGFIGEKDPMIEGWRCVYDVRENKFFVPENFNENNNHAIIRKKK